MAGFSELIMLAEVHEHASVSRLFAHVNNNRLVWGWGRMLQNLSMCTLYSIRIGKVCSTVSHTLPDARNSV